MKPIDPENYNEEMGMLYDKAVKAFDNLEGSVEGDQSMDAQAIRAICKSARPLVNFVVFMGLDAANNPEGPQLDPALMAAVMLLMNAFDKSLRVGGMKGEL